jgi:ABC-type long-subunit fatty acid transport system fused permease/ATPase subunit
MLKSFFLTKEYGAYAWLMLAFLLSMIWYNVEILVFYNLWNKEIYDVIQSLQEERFWELFLGWDAGRFLNFITLTEGVQPSFVEIIVLYTPIAVYATWQTQRYCFRWREANTKHYMTRWENSTAKIEGGSQRIQEDLMIYSLDSLVQFLFFSHSYQFSGIYLRVYQFGMDKSFLVS